MGTTPSNPTIRPTVRPTVQIAAGIAVGLVTLIVSLGAAEIVVRLKNRATDNYDIEMWRYAKTLKRRSSNPVLSHEHIPSQEVKLQSITIRTNELGMRGTSIAPSKPHKRRVLFLGSSVTLGWGVPENLTTTQQLEKLFRKSGEDVEVLNAGIGNYNSERYVELFFSKLKGLTPTDIVVHFFLRDGEVLEAGNDGWIIKYSELAALLWMSTRQLVSRFSGKANLLDHYRAAYDPDAPGFVRAKAALKRLSDYAHNNNIRLYLALIPEMRSLQNYPFGFVNERMKEVATQYNYQYIDLYPNLAGLAPNQIWVLPADPHPNALGHQRMAESIYSHLTQHASIAP